MIDPAWLNYNRYLLSGFFRPESLALLPHAVLVVGAVDLHRLDVHRWICDNLNGAWVIESAGGWDVNYRFELVEDAVQFQMFMTRYTK